MPELHLRACVPSLKHHSIMTFPRLADARRSTRRAAHCRHITGIVRRPSKCVFSAPFSSNVHGQRAQSCCQHAPSRGGPPQVTFRAMRPPTQSQKVTRRHRHRQRYAWHFTVPFALSAGCISLPPQHQLCFHQNYQAFSTISIKNSSSIHQASIKHASTTTASNQDEYGFTLLPCPQGRHGPGPSPIKHIPCTTASIQDEYEITPLPRPQGRHGQASTRGL